MKHQSDRRPAVFVLNDATAPRLNPELAKEIGLNESLLFLQLEFWLRQSGTLQEDGQYWIYESVTDIQQVFSFWSRATINRIIHSLVEQELLQVGNFNKHRYDRTRWFTLNRTGIDKLKSVKVFDWWVSQNETRSAQNETGSAQNDTRSAQNGTTIPDLSSDLSSDLSPEKEEPPAADSPPWLGQDDDVPFYLEGEPETQAAQPRTAEQVKAGIRGALETYAATGGRPGVADPHQGDEWDPPFQVFCVAFLPGIDADRLPKKKRDKMRGEIRRLAEEVHATPNEAVAAIRDLTTLEDWMVGPAATPYNTHWATAFQNTLIADERLLAAQVASKSKRGNGHAVQHRPRDAPAFVNE